MKTIFLGLVVALAGCSMTRVATLYPGNESAVALGVLKATFTAGNVGHGTVEVPMPDGEIIRGEFSIVREGVIGFGTVFASVYGNGLRSGVGATGSAFSSNYSVAGTSQGTATGFGTKNTRIECEFLNDNYSGHGYGGCRTSTGALYRIQY